MFGRTRGHGGALISISVRSFEKLVGSSRSIDPYRSKVAEEMLLCEVITSMLQKHFVSL
jgi:hypothetical protein